MKNKFIILGSIYSFVFLSFFMILYNLQVVQEEAYKEQVTEISSRRNILQSLRGRIYDRNYDNALVYNISSYEIFLDTKLFIPTSSNVKILADMLKVSPSYITNLLDNSIKGKELSLIDNLNYQEVVEFIEHINLLSGIYWKRNIQRKYNNNESMSHVIGYVGDISVLELQTNSGYYNFDKIGKVGVEKQYEDLLRGKSGTLEEVINVFGEQVDDTQEVVQAVVPGNDIILTLDKRIQTLIEKALGHRVGSIVVLKPATGEILAMASYPSYNPNILVGASNTKFIADIQKDKNFPFLNRAIQSSTAPASTFKTLMSIALLAEDDHTHSNEDKVVYCSGEITIGNRIFKCWDPRGHGYVDYIKALAVSCNVYFYTVGTEILGVDTIVSYAKKFGFGKITGIDLPEEIPGTLPSKDWKLRRYNEQWQLGDTANIAIGQGYISTTPLQLASFVGGIINNGIIYKPHVVKEARDQVTGKIVYTPVIEAIETLNISPDIMNKIKKAMRGVVTHGTSKVVITTDKVNIAGKTGSSQIREGDLKKLHSWFISYGPYEAPVEEQIVVVVWIDAVNEWEWWGPKAANIIYEAIFGGYTYDEAVAELKRRGTWYL